MKRLSHTPYQSYRLRRRHLLSRISSNALILSIGTGLVTAVIFACASGAITYGSGAVSLQDHLTANMAIAIGIVDAIIVGLVAKQDD